MVKNLLIEYSDEKVTAFGGMRLMRDLLDKLKMQEYLGELNLPKGGSNRSYASADIVEGFWLSIWTGASRFVHADWLRYDTTLQEIFRFKKMPSQSTYSRFFGKFSWEKNTEIFTKMNYWFLERLNLGAITVDLDSTVITRYGVQEGSKVGYNPRKPGRKSHHPLMAFLAETQMVINAWMRPGNTASLSNCEAFLTETLEILKDKTIGLIRGDSGFYSDKMLQFFEQRNLNYILSMRFYSLVKWEIRSVTQWTSITPGIDSAEFQYNGRRCVVVRKNIQQRPLAHGKMLLFNETDIPQYKYSCYITNLNIPQSQVWSMYKSRADCENRIKELKSDFGIEQFCLKSFWGTEAAFRFIMMAYNLMSLFKHIALQKQTLSSMCTLKSYCFALGAWIGNHANRRVLKIALPVQRRAWLDGLFSKINNSSPPFHFSNA